MTRLVPHPSAVATGPWPDRVVVVGEQAQQVAAAAVLAGAPPLAADGDGFVLLSAAELDGAPDRFVDLPESSVSRVILRRPWSSATDAADMLLAAHRVLEPGGVLEAADYDSDRLFGGSAVRYPLVLQLDASPAAAATIAEKTLSPTLLSTLVAAAGFTAIFSDYVTEGGREYVDAAAYWEAVRDGRSGLLGLVPATERDGVLESVSEALGRLFPVGSVIDREPWHIVSGVRL